MTPTISCFYFHWYDASLKYIFIEYDNYFKVIINHKSIILTKQQLTLNFKLFQIYLISLLLTENTEDIMSITTYYSKKQIYGINTIWYHKHWNVYELGNEPLFTKIDKYQHRNPLNTQEPIRHSSFKKINKFMNFADNIYNSNDFNKIPEIIYLYYQDKSKELFDYFNRYIAHEKKIEILSNILHNYGADVYNSIRTFI
jgi:hypothetical protein